MGPLACFSRVVPSVRSSARRKLSTTIAPQALRPHLPCIGKLRSSSNRSSSIDISSRSRTRSSSSSSGGSRSACDNQTIANRRSPLSTSATGRTASLPAVWNTVNGCLDSLPDPSTGTLNWYSCGPTVYDSAHLGHARTYVSLDIIRRVLTDYFRFDIVYALGITDVDDKIIARARERGLAEWHEVAMMAAEYEKEFMDDMGELGVRPPDAIARVTDHVPDIIAYIEGIVKNGMAYEAEGGVYFDVEGMGSGYGKLGVQAASSTTPAGEGGSDLRGKRSHKDFALWKKAKPNEPWWESPFGRGRPGWHIECSAMTHSLFGPHLDLHSGGVDLKFPHHTNEIAQCEAHGCGGASAATAGRGGSGAPGGLGRKKPWVRHWLHTGHLNIEGLKMSKSLKNFVTVRDYLAGHSAGREAAAENFRMFCLMHKYSASVTFSEDRLEEASVVRGRFQRFLALADATIGAERKSRAGVDARRWGDTEKKIVEETSTCRREVRLALMDDFDTPRAVRHLAALCALVSTHLQRGLPELDLAPVVGAANYAAEALALLGVGSSSAMRSGEGIGSVKAGGAGDGGEDARSADGLPPAREIAAALVDFRRIVRKHVLERNLKNNLGAGILMKRDLLKLLDITRDETLPELGVHVHDGPSNECTWMILPPNSRRSSSSSSSSSSSGQTKPEAEGAPGQPEAGKDPRQPRAAAPAKKGHKWQPKKGAAKSAPPAGVPPSGVDSGNNSSGGGGMPSGLGSSDAAAAAGDPPRRKDD